LILITGFERSVGIKNLGVEKRFQVSLFPSI